MISELYAQLAINNSGLPIPVECLGTAFDNPKMLELLHKAKSLRVINGRFWVTGARLIYLDTSAASKTPKDPFTAAGSGPAQALDF